MATIKEDPQRKRVYKWEWAWHDWNRSTITLEEARKLVKKACKLWKLHSPRFVGRMPKGVDFSWYDEKYQLMLFHRNHLNPAIVMHETAHHIIAARYGTGFEDHGPEWLGVYVDLLLEFEMAPKKAIVASLKKRGLKFKLPQK